MSLDSKEKIIKSKARVRDQGEVFTPFTMVKEMVDILGEVAGDYSKTVLEPTCGNGNFLVAILALRLKTISRRKNIAVREYLVLIALSKIYGIDIMRDNVIEARSRLMSVVLEYFANTRNSADFLAAAETILERNIICGNSLKHKSEITILDWTPLFAQKGFEINPRSLAQIETDMKDVVTALSVEDIKEKVDNIFVPKFIKKKAAMHHSKEDVNQASLFREDAKGVL